MALNNSGPISLAGTTAGVSIEIENGGNGTTQISLNDAAVRTLAGVPSGAITMPTNFYGKSNRVVTSATISSDTANYTLNTAKATGYVAGKTDMTLYINSGVYVYSNSTGSYALTVDTSWAAGDTVTIVNNGTIVGRGGNGGQSGYYSRGNCCWNGYAGNGAGPGLLVQRATSINNLNRIAGGGGGGGGGAACSCDSCDASAGGGGGGIGISSGGGCEHWPGYDCNNGNDGSLTSAGNGGYAFQRGAQAGIGGAGGGYGSGGASGTPCRNCSECPNSGGGGGSAGTAVSGYGNVSWINTGTINGPTS